MGRAAVCLVVMLLIFSMAVPASAVTGASDARVDAVLDQSGACQVTLSMTLRVEQAAEIWLPIPENARSVSLNGSGASTDHESDALYVDLSDLTGNATGTFTVILRYTVPNTVSYTADGYPLLELPLLSGFAYPIDRFDFSLTLPEPVTYTPNFSSGYHQSAIESNLIYQSEGNQITGSADAPLKDHETMTLSLRLTEATFPRSVVEPWSAGTEDTIGVVLMILSLLFWLIFLRSAPLIRRRTLTPPEGVTAGELRCVLTGQGADLTMTVFSWAQLGYILIHLKKNGQVVLHKRMEMGNERGSYEQKLFRALFGKKRTVDGSGYHYANLAAKAAASRGSMEDLFKKSSGNVRILQGLGIGVGICGGASLAIALAGDALLAILVILLMSVVGGVGAWIIQRWTEGLHLRNKKAFWLGLGVSALWLALGFMGGEALPAALTVGFELLVGLGCAYGGRRTAYGRQTGGLLLGLRANLMRLPEDDLDRIRHDEPDFFFDMAPYALALGADKAFARQFGRQKLSPCSWLTTGSDHQLTADQWRQIMHRAADSLDERKKRLPLERLLGK